MTSIDMFSERIETVEKILQNYYSDQFLKVISIKCVPGSRQGGYKIKILLLFDKKL